MGITIHYSGKLDSPGVLPTLLIEAKHFCFQRHWKYRDIDERIIGTVERWIPGEDEQVKTATAPIDDTMRGVLISPHPDCEAMLLTFNGSGELCFYMPEFEPACYWENKQLSVKTQHAPLDVHISICELLHLIQDKYFPSLVVNDEGEYYQTQDPGRLAEHFGRLKEAMDRVDSSLEKGEPGDVADAIKGVLDESEGKPGKGKHRKLWVERGKTLRVRQPRWKNGHGTSAGKN